MNTGAPTYILPNDVMTTRESMHVITYIHYRSQEGPFHISVLHESFFHPAILPFFYPSMLPYCAEIECACADATIAHVPMRGDQCHNSGPLFKAAIFMSFVWLFLHRHYLLDR